MLVLQESYWHQARIDISNTARCNTVSSTDTVRNTGTGFRCDPMTVLEPGQERSLLCRSNEIYEDREDLNTLDSTPALSYNGSKRVPWPATWSRNSVKDESKERYGHVYSHELSSRVSQHV